MTLTLQNISKSFGELQVLRDVSLNIENGKAFGLLGRNGAGKTTAIRIIMDVFPPDSGKILFNGRPLSKAGVKIGYLPEERGMYPKKLISEQLIYFGVLRGMKISAAEKAAKNWVERFELTESYNKKLSTLSKGNQQKIQLAATLIHDPDVVVLDEPFSGLDPVNARLLKDIVNEQVSLHKIVLFSSHQMGYIEEFCENIAILNKGVIVLNGSLNQIKREHDRTKIFIREEGKNEMERLLKSSEAKTAVKNFEALKDGYKINLVNQEEKETLLKLMMDQDIRFDKFEVMEPTLEDIFIDKVGKKIETA